jgi:hypothetical protein
MDIFTFGGKYALDVPGQGLNLPFVEDPHMRLQYWGSNRMTHVTDIDADLKGYTKPISRDYFGVDEYINFAPSAPAKIEFVDYTKSVTDESRAVCPSFQFRSVELNRWEEPFINPIANVEIPFQWGVQTRILEKDAVFEKQPTPQFLIDSADWLPQGVPTVPL